MTKTALNRTLIILSFPCALAYIAGINLALAMRTTSWEDYRALLPSLMEEWG